LLRRRSIKRMLGIRVILPDVLKEPKNVLLNLLCSNIQGE